MRKGAKGSSTGSGGISGDPQGLLHPVIDPGILINAGEKLGRRPIGKNRYHCRGMPVGREGQLQFIHTGTGVDGQASALVVGSDNDQGLSVFFGEPKGLPDHLVEVEGFFDKEATVIGKAAPVDL